MDILLDLNTHQTIQIPFIYLFSSYIGTSRLSIQLGNVLTKKNWTMEILSLSLSLSCWSLCKSAIFPLPKIKGQTCCGNSRQRDKVPRRVCEVIHWSLKSFISSIFSCLLWQFRPNKQKDLSLPYHLFLSFEGAHATFCKRHTRLVSCLWTATETLLTRKKKSICLSLSLSLSLSLQSLLPFLHENKAIEWFDGWEVFVIGNFMSNALNIQKLIDKQIHFNMKYSVDHMITCRL